ncbi:transposase family protein [Enterococcus faecium]|nr:transposase family protein [Enterococcus faecium]
MRWGTTTVRLLMNDVSECRTYLELKKQRFKCKACQRTFVADTSVAKNTVSSVRKSAGLS